LSWQEASKLLATLKQGITTVTSSKSGLALTILFAALIIVLALRAMPPPHTADESIYHLSVTKRFVEQGRVFPVSDNWAGNMPFLLQMLYAVCLMSTADISATL